MAKVKSVGQAGNHSQKNGIVRRFLKKYIDMGTCDYSFLFLVVYLVLFGTVMMFCASLYTDSYFSRQRMFALIGFGAMLVVSHINCKLYKILSPLIFIAGFFVIMLLHIGFGVEINESVRWVELGPISFQPAELFKIAVIIFNAAFLSNVGKDIRRPLYTSIYFWMTVLEVAIVFFGADNLSTAIIVGVISAGMFFVARPNWRVVTFWGVSLSVLATAIIWIYYQVKLMLGEDDFRVKRVLSWLGLTESSESALSDQVTQALYAIGSGGFWGKGFSNSTQKMVLPESMNDTVFAIVVEELGFVGGTFVIISYAMLLYRMYIIIRNSKTTYGSFLVIGIFTHIAIQVIFNIAVVTNLMPTTGVTLPFFSYGGTALTILLAEMGIVLNVSRKPVVRNKTNNRNRTT